MTLHAQFVKLNIVNTTSNSITYGISKGTGVVITGVPLWNSSNVKVVIIGNRPKRIISQSNKNECGKNYNFSYCKQRNIYTCDSG